MKNRGNESSTPFKSGSLIEIVGRSSLVIVPVPEPSAIAAVPFERLTVNVSSASTVVSPPTSTLATCDVSPGWKVNVRETAV